MELDLELRNNTLVARAGGELDLASAGRFRAALEEALDRHPVRNIVFNLERVTFIDSSGLGVLLGRYKRIAKSGGRVLIVGAQPQVRRILELSGLLRIMGEFASEEEALDKVG
ncbi:MAG: anti-sigma F factor antagonist [Firmicutes bacterium]|nr:anti-sigma F factor antagonist [Bacillota bacterium]